MNAETVEYLTDVIARQARIIRELYNTVEQLSAATSLAPEIVAVQKEAYALGLEIPDEE
jgi:hypothetical protein